MEKLTQKKYFLKAWRKMLLFCGIAIVTIVAVAYISTAVMAQNNNPPEVVKQALQREWNNYLSSLDVTKDAINTVLKGVAGNWSYNEGSKEWIFTSTTFKNLVSAYLSGTSVIDEITFYFTYDQSTNKVTNAYLKEGSKGEYKQLSGNCTSTICNGVITILAWIIYGFAYVAGLLLTFIIWIFIEIIQYNDFVNVPTVVTGWVIIRDLCNMFFVLILLVIAFATILRIESYSVKKLLPKLIIMAVLINFSRTIFGLIIDFGQVIMLTFVSGFAQHGSGEFIRIFQVTEYLNFSNTGASLNAVGFLGTLGALVAGFIAMLTTLVVMIVFVAVIVMRIIMLWIYTMLSPLVFLGRAFPAAEKFTEQIWGDFIKQVMVGPLLAFFVWLALLTAQSSAGQLSNQWSDLAFWNSGNTQFQRELAQVQARNARDNITGTMSGLFTADNFIKYIIVIGLLVGGLTVTQSMGGAAASIAGKGLDSIQKGRGLAWGGIKNVADWANRTQRSGGVLQRFGVKGTGIELNLARTWGTLSEKMEEMKKKQINAGDQRSRQIMEEKGRMWGTLAMTGNAGDTWEQITTLKGFNQRFLQGTKGGIFGTGGGKGLNIKRARLDAELGEKDEKENWIDPNSLGARREKIWSKNEVKKHGEELGVLKEERSNLNSAIKDLNEKIEVAKVDRDTAPAGERAKAQKVLDELLGQRSVLSSKAKDLNKKIVDKKDIMHSTPVDDAQAKALDKEIKAKKQERSDVAPLYQFEATATDNKAVQEEMGKLKDIDDADELVRILKIAIDQRDKIRAKAVIKKLTEDYNDNEYLEGLVPRAGSGYEGLQQLMRAMSGRLNNDDKNKYGYEYLKHLEGLNVGMSEQEAMTLGAWVAEKNKNTNHWEATAAYVMEDGKFREATEKEHTLIASTEFGKRGPQANMRDNNRLAYGKHFFDEDGEKHYQVTKIGQIMLQSYDVDRMIDRLPENMTESAAKFIYEAAAAMQKANLLVHEDIKHNKLADRIREKKNRAGNFDRQYGSLLDDLPIE